MAAIPLVNLVGICGGCWLAAGIAFLLVGRVPRTIFPSWQEKQASSLVLTLVENMK